MLLTRTLDHESVRPYLSDLARIFRSSVLRSIARDGRSAFMDSVLQSSGVADALPSETSVGETFDHVFEVLDEWYRCEYVFKNQLTRHLLATRHGAGTSFLFEFRVAGRIADAAAFNGTSTVYEIKTGLDNLDRLDDQLEAYARCFDKVYVATEGALVDEVAARLPGGVGLVAVHPGGDVEEVEPSASHVDQFDPGPAFDVLRKGEFVGVAEQALGGVPDVPEWELYDACRGLFCDLEPVEAHGLYFEAICARERVEAEVVSMLPPSLTAAGLGAKLTNSDREALPAMLANRAS